MYYKYTTLLYTFAVLYTSVVLVIPVTFMALLHLLEMTTSVTVLLQRIVGLDYLDSSLKMHCGMVRIIYFKL